MPEETNQSPPSTTREQRQAKKQSSTAAIEFVRKQINILKPYELSQSQRLRTFEVMLQDDSVATCFSARTMAIAKAQSNGKFIYDENSPTSVELKNFLEYNMDNFKGQSKLTIAMCASQMLKSGWSPFETVFEPAEDEWTGRWKVKKLAYINPITLDSSRPYQVAAGGDSIEYLRQKPDAFVSSNGISSHSYTGWKGVKEIDFRRVVYSSSSATDSSPAGQSMFEAAYIPWKEKQLLQDLTLIGVQKDMAGMPVLGAPASLLAAAEENPTGAEAKMVEDLRKNMANLHNGDQAFVMLPTDTHNENGSGQKMFDFTFKGVEGGGKAFDVANLVEQRRKAIFSTFGCLNLISGEAGGSSYNLLEGQNAILAHYAELDNLIVDDMFNKQLFPLLLRLNGIKVSNKDMPKWVHGDVQPVSIDEIGKYFQRVARMLPAVPQVVNELLAKGGINYRLPLDTTPEEIRELLFDLPDSKAGLSEGSSGTGDSQSGGSNSDNNSENAA